MQFLGDLMNSKKLEKHENFSSESILNYLFNEFKGSIILLFFYLGILYTTAMRVDTKMRILTPLLLPLDPPPPLPLLAPAAVAARLRGQTMAMNLSRVMERVINTLPTRVMWTKPNLKSCIGFKQKLETGLLSIYTFRNKYLRDCEDPRINDFLVCD